MKIDCKCGNLIVDQTDNLPYKAHLIPDQEWLDFLDTIDAAIGDVHAGKLKPEDAYMAVRRVQPSRLVWQCRSCGRLFIDDNQHKLNTYVPAGTDDSKEILSSRD